MDKNKKKNDEAEAVKDIAEKEEEQEVLDEETSVIQEQIKPWHKRKFKKVMSVIGFSLLAGIIFGIAARFVFKYSDGIISKIFGLNQPYDSPNSQPPVTLSPSQDGGLDPRNNEGVKINQDPIGTTGDNTQKKTDIESDGTALTEYRRAMDEMRLKAEAAKKGTVTIEGITSIVNWLGESIEQSEDTMGIIVAENPNDLFILTYYDKVKNADRIEVTLRSGNTYKVSFLNYDESYNMAVLLLSKQALKLEDFSTLSLLDIGNSDELYTGMPVIAIGTIDGTNEILEYGVVTSDSFTEYITDAAIGIFTTDVQHSENGEGIMTDLDGKVIGIVTRKLGSNIMPGVNKCMRVNDLVKVAEKLCNGENRVYFGIKAENIPAWALRENNIESGIYVNGVEPSSPASDAGLRKGDFIMSVNGVSINGVNEFSDILMQATEDTNLTIEIYRVSKTAEPRFSVTVKPVKRNN